MNTPNNPEQTVAEVSAMSGSLVGVRLGKYEVVDEIGRGSMGTVYLGQDHFAGRNVAIKVAHPEVLQDPVRGSTYRKLFFNEAKIAGLLKHPNIIAVYDACVDDGGGYLVMEHVPGGRTLKDHCTPDKLLSVDEVVGITFKCAKALDYAHRKGVVHRDIKPGNILRTAEGEVKLSDFGIAMITQLDATETQLDGAVGSPLYMSPEQIREEQVTQQSDLFSLGVVMYELLTGRHPFSADSFASLVHRIIGDSPTPVTELRADVPAGVENIIGRALEKKPSERYRSGVELAGDLSLVFDYVELFQDGRAGTEKFDCVRELSFFRDFTDPEIWEVINASRWQDFSPQERIIEEGDMDDAFFVVISGEVAVRKGEKQVNLLGEGDCFGEMGFIARQQRTASIVANTAVTAMKVRASLMERASKDCQLRFHKAFLNTLITRLSQTTEKVGD